MPKSKAKTKKSQGQGHPNFIGERSCTCFPAERPEPCQRFYAVTLCWKSKSESDEAALKRKDALLYRWLNAYDHYGTGRNGYRLIEPDTRKELSEQVVLSRIYDPR